jgi:hypothetical protein
MRKATITDIASMAEVSTATVDRVLNGRPGVSAVNRQRVNTAAKALGYLPSEDKITLPSRPAHLEFFLPLGQSEFMHTLAVTIRDFAASLPLVASCRIHPIDGLSPGAVVKAIEKTALQTSGVGLITVDHPICRNAIRQLCEAGLRVVTIASDVLQTPRSAYVGVDNRVAGRTAGLLMGRMARNASGSIALFLGSRAYHGHEEREAGFRTDRHHRTLLRPTRTSSGPVRREGWRRRQGRGCRGSPRRRSCSPVRCPSSMATRSAPIAPRKPSLNQVPCSRPSRAGDALRRWSGSPTAAQGQARRFAGCPWCRRCRWCRAPRAAWPRQRPARPARPPSAPAPAPEAGPWRSGRWRRRPWRRRLRPWADDALQEVEPVDAEVVEDQVLDLLERAFRRSSRGSSGSRRGRDDLAHQPARTASRIQARCGAQRPFWLTASFTPLSRASATRRRPSSRSRTKGFCDRTCLPAFSAASMIGRRSAGCG